LPKKGLLIANGVGIFDEDFSGNNDEYRLAIFNYTQAPVTIERGERLCQIMILPFERVEWQEVDDLGNADRGGFGTTG